MKMGKERIGLFSISVLLVFGFLVFCIGAFIVFDCIIYPTKIYLESLVWAFVFCLAGPIIVNTKNETLQKRYLSVLTFIVSVVACLLFVVLFIRNPILGTLVFAVVFLLYALHRLLKLCKNEYG
jgi:hypothetical protein